MSRTIIRCGELFDGVDLRGPSTLVLDRGKVTEIRAGALDETLVDTPGDVLVDASAHFVMPGMVDVHTHLAYGNAKTEEDIDLYGTQEFRAIRGMFFAGQVLAAGITSIGAPGGSGHVSTA
ncbi:MAG: hypothetical protein WAX14_01550, partial [Rhodococcus sp. (in: high G+C Gram-positive bacteria)]